MKITVIKIDVRPVTMKLKVQLMKSKVQPMKKVYTFILLTTDRVNQKIFHNVYCYSQRCFKIIVEHVIYSLVSSGLKIKRCNVMQIMSLLDLLKIGNNHQMIISMLVLQNPIVY